MGKLNGVNQKKIRNRITKKIDVGEKRRPLFTLYHKRGWAKKLTSFAKRQIMKKKTWHDLLLNEDFWRL